MNEQLHSCPKCGRENFTLRGLKAHHCKPSPMPMPKPTPTSELETCIAGQPKASTMKLLRQAGEHLTIERMVDAVSRVERARADFVLRALETGIYLLAKKESLKHGQFQSYCAQIWSRIHQEDGQVLAITGEELDNYTRQLRKYAFLAQHFIAAHQQDRFPSEYRDRRVMPPAVSTEEILDLVVVGGVATERITSAITAFVAGRSLSRMLMDFRAAENASDAEEFEEQVEAEKRRRKKLPDQAPGQADFYDELMKPMTDIDVLLQDPHFRRQTTKQFWTNVADKLEAQASQARAVAREMAS